MSWPGGKDGAGVAQRLINEIPPHDVFVSAFLGDCAVLRRKRPARLSIGIDLDRENVDRWARSPFRAPLELYCCDAVEWLRHRFAWYQVAAIGGPDRDATNGVWGPEVLAAGNGDGTRCRSAESRSTATLDLAALPEGKLAGRVAAAGDAGSAVAVPSVGARKMFVYADPPYMLDTRSSKGRLYKHELSDEQHVDLVETLKSLPCLVMVNHYPCALYNETFADWRSFTFQSVTRGGKKATEKVWCNYPAPIELHDASYLGGTKREREMIRRRRQTLERRLRRLPPLEQQALLLAITSR